MPFYDKKDESTLEALENLHKKTEAASAIMGIVLDTHRQISDDNARQGKKR